MDDAHSAMIRGAAFPVEPNSEKIGARVTITVTGSSFASRPENQAELEARRWSRGCFGQVRRSSSTPGGNVAPLQRPQFTNN